MIAYGVPVGLGSHVHWDRRLDALVAQALMSIQAIKAVEFGDGFELAGRRGSEAHDAIRTPAAAGEDARAGWVGGMSRHPPRRGDRGWHLHRIRHRGEGRHEATGHPQPPDPGHGGRGHQGVDLSFKERTDVTAVPAMGVVAETMVALVLASEALRKFGGDSVEEFRRNQLGYLAALGETPSAAAPPADG